MKTVCQLLDAKGRKVYSTTPTATVFEALQTMAEAGVGALVVLDGEQLVGIFSERDYARNVILKGKSSKSTPISDIMTSQLITVTPGHTVEDCMNLMTDNHVRHLPVLENGRLIGLLSIGDVVKETIEYQQFLIQQLERYITL